MPASGPLKRRLLVVEDEPSIAIVCQRVLAGEGLEVDVARNGKIAQDMIKQKPYDYYLLDIKMPVLDGKELFYWLREKYPATMERVMFMTGESLGAETHSFLKETGVSYLTKPFTPSELRAKLKGHFQY